jgi:hypothetical protein
VKKKVSFSSGIVFPSASTVEGDGVAGGFAASVVQFNVQLRDQFSNPVAASANVTVTVIRVRLLFSFISDL